MAAGRRVTAMYAAFLISLALLSGGTSASPVDSGVYRNIVVRLSEAVPRQHCLRALRNVEVSRR